ncbi:MAG: tRNA guanosine(34) transglycosylase Tgt [Flavobacteriales bacterium]|jgi:queuine tRNA-ribosyltransferase|nr:tRNA guanosine(34) transglycosylase Tgt [Flavobacteriales bacterium]MBT5932090.1 tRNA guanosine(34) transglycosylase Tgt [Flavobacteriales bacterium]MDA7762922.1 tRNA guanosine(34) transglycosylase Tgt [Crocinitomicaceae bacterium]
MHFDLIHSDPDSNARAGILMTDHGPIETPIFMPVGTSGSVKGVHQKELEHDVKAEIILGNTYHLFLRPGTDIIERAGGLHKFISWNKPILTDSGGYQVYSLSGSRKINEEGVKFQSHIDGSYHFFTPERAIDIQKTIGADIIMAFDECTPYPCDYTYAKNSMKMTHRWLNRCVDQMNKTEGKYGYTQALFPIIQGSTYKDLRKESAEYIASMDAVGNAIGGLSVGEPEEDLYEMTALVTEVLPKSKPRYLMGVGTPSNLLECIALGVDMFDCVMPSRNARHGLLYTENGTINIKNQKWSMDYSLIDENSPCWVDTNYTKAYLRHLIKSGEYLGIQIATIHNLSFYLRLMKEARERIIDGSFVGWKNKMVKQLNIRL